MLALLIVLLSLGSVTLAVGQYFEPFGRQRDAYGLNSYNRFRSYGPSYGPSYSGLYNNQAYQLQSLYARNARNMLGYGSSVGLGAQKSGYGHSGGHSHAVVHKKQKKKQKIISIDKGLFIAGGTQAFGKFKSLKSCMKACASSPACFAGDYNPWLGKCYFHGNITACNTMSSHSKLTHFKKIPCSIPGAPRSRTIIGAQLFGGILQKGINSLPGCLKKCINSGGGIASAPTALDDVGTGGQLCFGIDYDFGSHKCYFHVVNRRRLGTALSALCPETAAPAVFVPVDLTPNPSVIHILVCPAM